jgi:hypothetical protein
MSAARIRKLQGDARTLEAEVWSKWLRATGKLVDRFVDELGDDPFAYNETATVSVLCSGAALAGGLSLAEYALTKRAERDRRKSAPGRCDLYMLTPGRSWGFEFKQLFPYGVPKKRLETAWDAARRCASCLPTTEADHRVAALVVSLYRLPEAKQDTARDALREFAPRADYAWELQSSTNDHADTFFYFDMC